MDLSPAAPTVRRYYLDWLRVLAILSIFFFHSIRFFDPLDWHVKNSPTVRSLAVVMDLFTLWGMPLIFVISGASLYYSLRSRRAGQFVKERVLRLLVPLLTGLFTLVPVMVYLDRLSHHRYFGSFIAWLPDYFNGLEGYGGNFAWTGLHLWYLEVLFVYSLLLLPLFIFFKTPAGQRLLAGLERLLAVPGALYLLALPVIFLRAGIEPGSLGLLTIPNFGGWYLPVYLFFLLNGYLLGSSERLQEQAERLRWLSLGLAGLALAFLLWQVSGQAAPAYGSSRYTLFFAVYGFCSWLCLLAILGFARRHLSAPRPILAYANEAVLPFYILHQPVLLVVGFYVLPWTLPIPVKWALVAALSLASIFVIYEFAIRRVNLLRFLFGLKPRPRPAPVPTPAGAPM